MIIYENGFGVGVWVCECVSNPTRKLEWLNKLEIGYKTHALDYVWKEMKSYFKLVYETCSDLSDILYIARRHPTKLSEAYPLPYYM